MKIKFGFTFEVTRSKADRPQESEQFEHRDTHSDTQLADTAPLGFTWNPPNREPVPDE